MRTSSQGARVHRLSLRPARRDDARGMQSRCVTRAPDASAPEELEMDWSKVLRLRAAIEERRYEIDAQAVAEAIVARSFSVR